MNSLMIFENNNVEILELNGEVLFNPKQVGKCLDMSESVIRDHISNMDNDEVIKLKNSDISDVGLIDFRKLNNAGESFLTESGVYALIMKSRKPSASKFQKWVTKEVLPSIRKNGMYATDELLDNPDLLIQVATKLKQERQRNKELENKVNIQTQQIVEMKPKANYYDIVLNCTDLLTTTIIAKDYGKSAVWFNKYLENKKVQYKQSGIWLLYQKYAEQGYTSTKTKTYIDNEDVEHTKVYTCWTQKGRLFLYDLLKSDGILPLIELE